ncbi:MAG: Zn-dependent alcohol dehydrogenase [Myxococcota bacterium]|nr:Zn-dependent alcohol dehydrogenase [Myxococcota bacterium]
MGKKAKAAVVRELNAPVVIEELEVESPKLGEVMVKMKACGVCHSDYSTTNGTIPMPPPLVMGHEAAGIVEEVGPGVTDIAVGDHVVIVWVPMCGKCRYCAEGRPQLCDAAAKAVSTMTDGTTRYTDKDGNSVSHMAGVGVMSEYATVHRDNVLKIDPDIPLDRAALVGCAVMTGVGAALNTAKIQPGTSVAVFGAGGIGLNTIQGAALAGAERIIAVDLEDKKLEYAQQFGATHTVNPSTDGDAVAKIMELTAGGADYAFECIGVPDVIVQAYNSIRKGGTAVVVGVTRPDGMITLPTFLLPFQEKVLTGSMYGSGRPNIDFPRLLGLYKANRLKLDELVTKTYTIDQVNEAFDDMNNGVNARGVIVF